MFLLLSLYPGFLCAFDGGSSDDECEASSFNLVLKRLENKDKKFIGGGTHNPVGFSCMQEGKYGCQGMLYAGRFKDDINIKVPTNPLDLGVMLCIGKYRYSIFRKSDVSEKIVVREYGRSEGEYEDVSVAVQSMPYPRLGDIYFVLKFGHKSGKGVPFTALCQTVLAKQQSAVSGVVVHSPPEGAVDYTQVRPAYNRAYKEKRKR